MSARPILLAAGGTGGHLFPAEALARVLAARGHRVDLVTEERALRLGLDFPSGEVHEVASATVSERGMAGLAVAGATLARGLVESWRLIGRLRPAAVVGFGGYLTVPPVLASALRGVPTLIHEQNGVLGRANRLLAPRVRAIATGFPEVAGLGEALWGKTTQTGNPVRAAVIEAARTPFPPVVPGGPLRLLVFGGSQGARVMSDVVPAAIERLGPEARRLAIVQQAREEDVPRVRDTYARLGVGAEVQPFFRDLPRRMAEAHLVVARSGASTVAELAVVGRPGILVPLPGSLDGDQAANAASLARIGAAAVIAQADFTPERLAEEIARRLDDGEGLIRAANAAKSAGIPDAAERLAGLVLGVAGASIPLEAAA